MVSFTIESLEPFLARLEVLHIEAEQRNIGPTQFVAFRDPDGRYVCCGTPWPGT